LNETVAPNEDSGRRAALPSQYDEWPVSSRLVRCRWEQVISRIGDYEQRVLPDGCADVLVDALGGVVVVGPTPHPAVVKLSPGTAYRCLRLRPGAVRSVFGLPAQHLTNQVLRLEDVTGNETTRLLTRAALGDELALIRLEGLWGELPVDPRVPGALAWLGQHPDRDISDLALAAGLSSRQLRRLLIDHAGLGPKSFQRVFRLHHFLRAAEQPRSTTDGLAELATRTGYADQAHLSREVRALAGLPPVALLRERFATRDA